MPTIRVSTDLPLTAESACALAQQPALFAHVTRPLFSSHGLPDSFDGAVAGEEVVVRLWWLGAIPSWRHHLRVVEVGERELLTSEHGGPVRRWDHRLTFAPLPGGRGCRYTDEVALDAGPATPLVWLFAHVMYRYRQSRWRALARVIGAIA